MPSTIPEAGPFGPRKPIWMCTVLMLERFQFLLERLRHLAKLFYSQPTFIVQRLKGFKLAKYLTKCLATFLTTFLTTVLEKLCFR